LNKLDREETKFEDIPEDHREELRSQIEMMSEYVESEVRRKYKFKAVEALRDFEGEEGARGHSEYELDRIERERMRREIKREIRREEENQTSNQETFVRKEMAVAGTLALYGAYKKLNKSRVIWVTVLDDVTCSDCASLDGSKMDLKRARSLLPLHPNCRCTIISVDEYGRWSS